MKMDNELSIKNIYAIWIYVSNLEQSIDFYQNKIGLKVNFRNGDWIEFNLGKTSFAILQRPSEKGKVIPVKTRIMFETDDIETFYKYAIDNGIKCIGGIRKEEEKLRTYNVLLKTPTTQSLQQIYTAELGVREATGRNDGSRVEAYRRYVRLKPGNPWCAAFAGHTDRLVSPTPVRAIALICFPQRESFGSATHNPSCNPLPGDVFGIYFQEKGRIAHVGFVDE